VYFIDGGHHTYTEIKEYFNTTTRGLNTTAPSSCIKLYDWIRQAVISPDNLTSTCEGDNCDGTLIKTPCDETKEKNDEL
jgi:hypothetical protein